MNLIEKNTGDLYSDCWQVLKKEQWLAQGELLADQLGLTSNQVQGKTCLDGGCGHGALSYRLHLLGAKEVVGVDLKPTPPKEIFEGIPSVKFVEASLIKLPLNDQSFDLVVSSGVIHHTINPEKCFSELSRVLKSGGTLTLGVYGKHGLFSYCLWVARLFTVKIPILRKSIVSKLVDLFRLDPIWRYQVLDYLYVPILHRYSPNEVKEMFLRNGLVDPRRISNISEEKAKKYVSQNTSYSYDHRRWTSKLLFGYGFIVITGHKK